MSKQRAFVRYNKTGEIVPGSLITSKTWPKGPGLWYEVTYDMCCNNPEYPSEYSLKLKQRAFVRFTKDGKVIPGSLIITKGSHPSGPSTWKEIPADLCCASGPVPPSVDCSEFVSYYDNRNITNPDYFTEYGQNSVVDSECNTYSFYALQELFSYETGITNYYLITKKDNSGNILWEAVKELKLQWIDSFFSANYAVNMVIDEANNLYVTSTCFIFKLNGLDGSTLWYKAAFGPERSLINAVSYSNNNLYISFSYSISGGFDMNTRIVQLNKNTGAVLNEKTYTLTSNPAFSLYQYNSGPYIDDAGNLYLGLAYVISGLFYGVIIKLNSSLDVISTIGIDRSTPSGLAIGDGDPMFIGKDSAGNLYSATYEKGVFKLDSSNNLLWFKNIDYLPNMSYSFNYVYALTKNGEMFLVQKTPDNEIALIKLNSNGDLVYATHISDSVSNNLGNYIWYETNCNLQIDAQTGALTITLATASQRTALLIKLDANAPQVVGTYGTTTFADVTSDYGVTALTPDLFSENITASNTTSFATAEANVFSSSCTDIEAGPYFLSTSSI